MIDCQSSNYRRWDLFLSLSRFAQNLIWCWRTSHDSLKNSKPLQDCLVSCNSLSGTRVESSALAWRSCELNLLRNITGRHYNFFKLNNNRQHRENHLCCNWVHQATSTAQLCRCWWWSRIFGEKSPVRCRYHALVFHYYHDYHHQLDAAPHHWSHCQNHFGMNSTNFPKTLGTYLKQIRVSSCPSNPSQPHSKLSNWSSCHREWTKRLEWYKWRISSRILCILRIYTTHDTTYWVRDSVRTMWDPKDSEGRVNAAPTNSSSKAYSPGHIHDLSGPDCEDSCCGTHCSRYADCTGRPVNTCAIVTAVLVPGCICCTWLDGERNLAFDWSFTFRLNLVYSTKLYIYRSSFDPIAAKSIISAPYLFSAGYFRGIGPSLATGHFWEYLLKPIWRIAVIAILDLVLDAWNASCSVKRVLKNKISYLETKQNFAVPFGNVFGCQFCLFKCFFFVSSLLSRISNCSMPTKVAQLLATGAIDRGDIQV